MPFKSQGGNVKDIFVTEEELIERFTGKQLWSWGPKPGNNSAAAVSSPVQTISGGYDWRTISAGSISSAAIKTDGTLWLWGYNSGGALGNNLVTAVDSPVQTISGGNNWRNVSIGYARSAAIKTDGTLWLWGCNVFGEIGDGTNVSKSSPVQTLSGGTNWKSVNLGLNHTSAIKTDGTLWMWGSGGNGRLGSGSSTHQSSPVQTISGGTNWRSVSSGGTHTAAIKTDGTLWLWGNGDNGQIGDNTISTRISPVQTISSGNNWRIVEAGRSHVAAIKTDGSLWLWGSGFCGTLGTNSTASHSSPVQTISGGTNWRSIAAGEYRTTSIKADGSLWIWGVGSFGALGNGTTTSRSSPVQTVALGNNWRTVSIGVTGSRSVATRLEEF